MTWQVDPVAAGRLGLTIEQVATSSRTRGSARRATNLRLLDRTIPVRVRYPDAVRFNAGRWARRRSAARAANWCRPSALVRVSQSTGPAELMRENLRQMALVTARLEDRDLGSAVADVQAMLRSMSLPVGYTYEVGGQYESQHQAFQDMLLVAGVAAALVFVDSGRAVPLVHRRPRSFSRPRRSRSAARFALLLVTGTDLNVSSAMGLILLVGLVVKNGIVLLDFADRRLAEGHPVHDAVLTAARVRLRPILMTTLCTLFGLLPLALGIGAGAELQKPLALAVIGGLACRRS